LVTYQKYTKMHGPKNIIFRDAKQAKQLYQYKNIKTKLYKNNAAIWYNKRCRIKEFHLDLHTGRPLTESDYIRSCIHTFALLRMSTQLLETCRGFKLTYHRRNSASSWLSTRIIRRCTVRKILYFVMQNKPNSYINTRTSKRNCIRTMQLSGIIKSVEWKSSILTCIPDGH